MDHENDFETGDLSEWWTGSSVKSGCVDYVDGNVTLREIGGNYSWRITGLNTSSDYCLVYEYSTGLPEINRDTFYSAFWWKIANDSTPTGLLRLGYPRESGAGIGNPQIRYDFDNERYDIRMYNGSYYTIPSSTFNVTGDRWTHFEMRHRFSDSSNGLIQVWANARGVRVACDDSVWRILIAYSVQRIAFSVLKGKCHESELCKTNNQ